MNKTATPQASTRILALRSLDQLPPFSPVLAQLMASLSDDEVPLSKLASTIERDTALSGNVLRLANSSLYGRRGEVASVRAAMSLLGLTKLRNYLFGLSISRMWNRVQTPPAWDLARFNGHALAAAIWADLLVQHFPVQYPEGAFVAGLLHDTGRLLVAVALPARWQKVMACYEAGGRTLEDCEFDELDVTHSSLSEAALARWNLPAPIQKAVLYHHRAHQDPDSQPGGPVALSAVVEAADALANSAGSCVCIEDFRLAPPAVQVFSQLGLTHLQDHVQADFDAEFQAIRASY